jgi:hypothetical protein
VRISASATVDDFEEGSKLDEIISHQGQNPHRTRAIAGSLGMSPKGATETESQNGKFYSFGGGPNLVDPFLGGAGSFRVETFNNEQA